MFLCKLLGDPLPLPATWGRFCTPEEKSATREGNTLNFVANFAASHPGAIVNEYLACIEPNFDPS